MTPADLFATTIEAFSRATATAGGTTLDVRIAGRQVRVRCAGRTATAVLPALARLAAEPISAPTPLRPDLTLSLWDATGTGVALPRPSLRGSLHGPVGRLSEFSDSRFRTTLDSTSEVVTVLDLHTAEALWFAADARRLASWEQAHPARVVLADWAADQGLRMLHAAAVGTPAGGLLVAGPSGAGKSTTALACRRAGMLVAGDNYVLVEPGPPLQAHAVYSSVRLDPKQLRRFPRLRSDAEQLVAPDGKALFYERPAPVVGIQAVLVPRVEAGGRSRVGPISRGRALLALAPSSLAQVGSFEAESFAALGALCRSLPSYELTLGADLEAVPALLSGLIERLS